MKDDQAEMAFRKVRWADTDGAPVCPHCGGVDAYDCRRLKGAPRFRCRACVQGFHDHVGHAVRLPQAAAAQLSRGHRDLLQRGQGQVGAGALARSWRSYKTAFVLLHKLREAMAAEMKGRTVGGEGKVAEVDGGYFGGYVKPANIGENRRDRRLVKNQNGKRKVVVIVRERDGNSLPAVFRSESQALNFIRSRVAKGTDVNADEAGSWEGLHDRFEVKRINHQEAYSADGACTNWAEEFFSRMRRAEIGHHHHIAGAYLLRYAQEASWREDNRREANGEQVAPCRSGDDAKPSVDFSGYWQRHVAVD